MLSMCEKALLGYCSFHHILLFLAQRYPCIRHIANERVKSFKAKQKNRHKMHVRNLGHFLIYLCLSDLRWEDIREEFMAESLARSVLWACKNNPELKQIPGSRNGAVVLQRKKTQRVTLGKRPSSADQLRKGQEVYALWRGRVDGDYRRDRG